MLYFSLLTCHSECPGALPGREESLLRLTETLRSRRTLPQSDMIRLKQGLLQTFTRIHFQKRTYIVMTSIEFGGSNDNSTTSLAAFAQESHRSRCMRRTGRVLRHQFLLVPPGFPDRADSRRRTEHPCLYGNHGNRAERIDMESGWRIQIAEIMRSRRLHYCPTERGALVRGRLSSGRRSSD
jgi:hypothetical protein